MQTKKVVGRQWSSISAKMSGETTEEFEQEEIDVGVFESDAPVAIAKVSVGSTINVGDYNSARCDVGVELPCYVEELPDALKTAYKMAVRMQNSIVRGVRNSERSAGLFPLDLSKK